MDRQDRYLVTCFACGEEVNSLDDPGEEFDTLDGGRGYWCGDCLYAMETDPGPVCSYCNQPCNAITIQELDEGGSEPAGGVPQRMMQYTVSDCCEEAME